MKSFRIACAAAVLCGGLAMAQSPSTNSGQGPSTSSGQASATGPASSRPSQELIVLAGKAVTVERITPILDKVVPTYHVHRADKPPAIDGNADEWAQVEPMPVGTLEQYAAGASSVTQPTTGPSAKSQPAQPVPDPNDISGAMRLMWDANALYFRLEVTDDVHRAPNGDKAFWENDCCQFMFDAYMNGPKGGYDTEEISFCVCDSPKGPMMVQYRFRGQSKEKETVIPGVTVKMSVRSDGVRVYEWEMPWTMLQPVNPWLLGRTGFSFVLVDNDGKGFKGGKSWTKGILWTQDASRFGQIVFDGAAGTRATVLAIPPEVQLPSEMRTQAASSAPSQPATQSYWMDIDGVTPFYTARLLVRSDKAGPIEAETLVYRRDGNAPVASGIVRCDAAAGQAVAFVWDLSALPRGHYEVCYRIPAISDQSTPRQPFSQLNMKVLRERIARLRDQYGLDRPWDGLAGASAIVRRHRGMLAVAADLANAGPLCRELLRVNPDGLMAALIDADVMLGDLEAGKDYLGGRRGTFLEAYYCAADATGQPFVVRTPPQYDSSKPWPLMVSLHGASGRPVPAPGGGMSDALEVFPWGRGDQSYRKLAEHDVLRIIAHMKEWYNVDDYRVYVNGASMGGSGTYWMASRHPDLFAAAGVRCGYTGGIALENLRHVPVWIQHGCLDTASMIEEARHGVDILREMGYAVTYREYPDAGHAVPDIINMGKQMLQMRRPARPDAITFTCETPETGQAYWLAIRRLADPHVKARADARVVGPATYQALSLRLTNIDVLELDTAGMPLEPNADLRVQVGTSELLQPWPMPQRLFVVRDANGWSLADNWQAPASKAREYRPGAAVNLHQGEPMMIVYGTGGDADRTALLKSAAAGFVDYGGYWRRKPVPAAFPVKADKDVTDDDIQHFNLILIGGAKENRIAARVADKLPVKVNDKGELLAGDREPVNIKGAAVGLHYYNPIAPQRLLYWVWTDEDGNDAKAWFVQPSAMVPMAGYDMDLGDQADLIVQTLSGFDSRDKEHIVRPGPYRRLMQFTHDWQWRAAPGADVPLTAAMVAPKALDNAQRTVIRRLACAEFAMSSNPSDADVRYDPQWITLADVATVRMQEQTLVCTLSGKDLLDLHNGKVREGKIVIQPPVTPEKIDPAKQYKVAMPLWLPWDLWPGKNRLQDVQAGPEYTPMSLWREVMGQ